MGKKGGMRDGSNCFKIVKMIMERQFAPVIVFSFSKKECEAYALQMAKLDFNTRKYVAYSRLVLRSNVTYNVSIRRSS